MNITRLSFFLTLTVSVTGGPTASITVSPKTGAPTSTTLLSGSGFGANGGAQIYFDSTPLVLVTADGSGVISGVPITVPKSSVPGLHSITARGQNEPVNPTASFTVRTNWPQFHRGALHQGDNYLENVLNPSNVGRLTLRWGTAAAFDLEGSSPAIVDGVAYIGSYDKNIYAFNATTGVEIWSAATGGFIESSPAVANGLVYAASQDGSLYAWQARTGSLVWKAATGGIGNSSPTVASGVVYIGSTDSNLYAFSAASGKLLWKAVTGGRIDSTPAVWNGMVYAGSADHSLYAFKIADGSLAWSVSTGGEVAYSPAVANGVVYFTSFDVAVYAVQAATGSLVWKFSQSGVRQPPIVGDGIVYIGGYSNGVGSLMLALSAATGSLRWAVPASASGALANGVLYTTVSQGLVALHASTGIRLWEWPGGECFSAPVVVNGTLFAGCYEQGLLAFGLLPGSASEQP
jgi:outer membrane protein assembly factor BamB